MGGMALAGQVREVELEAHCEFGRYRLTSLLDDTAESDRRVVGLAVDSRYRVGVRLGNRGKEMEVPSGQCRGSVDDAANCGAVAATENRTQLQGYVWESRLNFTGSVRRAGDWRTVAGTLIMKTVGPQTGGLEPEVLVVIADVVLDCELVVEVIRTCSRILF